jgi:peptide deformylase
LQATGVTIGCIPIKLRVDVTAAPIFSAMALLPILEFPDPRLRTKAVPVDPAHLADPAFQRLFDDMFETMYAAPGIGLAASQVDVHQRFMVIDVSEEKNRPLVFVNPRITARSGEQVYQEGCLSVPNIFADVTRANEITVTALDRHGEAFELSVDGLLAVCIQHEMDHLEGKLFVDYLSPLKREMVRKKLAKQRRLAADAA